jgi:peptidoglycan/xylan/chitin deacetylase (PgdA/CDA1 family)
MSRQTLDDLEKRRIVVFGADVIADDWIQMTPEAQLQLLTDRLKAAGKGIILLHDPQAQTAAVLPAFLRYLRDNGYSVVHVVPKEAARPVAMSGKTKNVNNSNN